MPFRRTENQGVLDMLFNSRLGSVITFLLSHAPVLVLMNPPGEGFRWTSFAGALFISLYIGAFWGQYVFETARENFEAELQAQLQEAFEPIHSTDED